MGVKGGVVVWCILIVGLLLAVSSTAERDTEKEKEEEIRWCKEDCDWKAGADTGKAKECKQQCERRRHGQEDDDRCGSKCQSHEEWWKKARCMRECKQRQKREGGNFDIEEIKAKCNEECEHHQRPRRKQRCFDDCMEYELFGGQWLMDMEERIVNSDGGCEKMCQHHHDLQEKKQCMKDCKYYGDGHKHGDHCQTLCKRFRPESYDRQQCIEKCQSQKPEDEEVMNHHGHGGGGHGHGGSSCEEDCEKRNRHG